MSSLLCVESIVLYAAAAGCVHSEQPPENADYSVDKAPDAGIVATAEANLLPAILAFSVNNILMGAESAVKMDDRTSQFLAGSLRYVGFPLVLGSAIVHVPYAGVAGIAFGECIGSDACNAYRYVDVCQAVTFTEDLGTDGGHAVT